jgi:uncharacterized protein YbjT (DUF2867 family)
LIATLVECGHTVRALVRAGSESKLSGLCPAVVGDALDAASFAHQVPPADTFVQLVGYPKPDPRKAKEFRAVDLRSGLAGVRAAQQAGIRHFVYVSVAHPAPIMKAYIEPRKEVEAAIGAARLSATILRPWYVLGPRHRWPYLLLPLCALFELLPYTRESARRLGLVRLKQMIDALVKAVENPSRGIRIVEVTDIRRGL